uniref:Uncharacterized protein n=1 Tax=Octopus bimaculoides TaxID=37653 RepID=A0A0L8IHW8_OCTBM
MPTVINSINVMRLVQEKIECLTFIHNIVNINMGLLQMYEQNGIRILSSFFKCIKFINESSFPEESDCD